jgi:hypothetical protein
MRYQCVIPMLAGAFVAALCAVSTPASAQDRPREGRERDSDRERDNDLRGPPRIRRDSGPDRFESSRSDERGRDRGRGERARDSFDRAAGRRPGGAARDPARGSRADQDDGWDEVAMRMRRPDGARSPQAGSRGPRGFGGFGPPGFGGGIISGVGRDSGGTGIGGSPSQRARSGTIASELRELNNKLDRLTSALERLSQR